MKLISFDQAFKRLMSAVPAPVRKMESVSNAGGLVSAGTVRSRVDLPLFDNSAVDGCAVIARDVRTASRHRPVALKLVETIWAGEWSGRPLKSGECSRIATGAPLPNGADAVIMQEDIQVDDAGRVIARRPVASGENVRRRAGDIRCGQVVLRPGQRVRPMDLMLAAQTGNETVPIYPRPRVAILSTGNELVAPGGRLARGKIFDGNTAGLSALSAWAGAVVTHTQCVGDRFLAVKAALRRCLSRAEVVVTCGGVSVGERDFLRSALDQMRGRQILWRVALKPGRPFAAYAVGRKRVLCLPGNPVSAFVTFMLFVKPVIEKLYGASSVPFAKTALLLHSVRRSNRRQFLRGRLRQRNGDFFVASAGKQESHMLSSLQRADCLFEVREGTGQLARGSRVRVLVFAF